MKPATLLRSQTPAKWVGIGRITIPPPPEYWADLASETPGPQLEQLKELSSQRLNEFSSHNLPPPEAAAIDLLNRLTSDGWLAREERYSCPQCTQDLGLEELAGPICPHCGAVYSECGGITTEEVFIRHLAQTRSVDWVVAIHGMNTSGTWQEEFSWMFSTTWGRSVPVAVYKYGIVIAGVLLAWRRSGLMRGLRRKLAVLRDQARAHGFEGNPDVIAHSFGTWLFGHLLKDEVRRLPVDQLRFGRVILTGCVLRPDFDWKSIKDAGLVEDVLNHYGTADGVVPLAHATIWDSGPSGRRGFDGDQVLNVQALGFGHSDLFSLDKCAVDGATCLAHSYQRHWRPFLSLPREELVDLPDRIDPKTSWRQLPWALRGTIFPFIALPFVAAILAFVLACVGRYLWEWRETIATFAGVSVLAGALIVVLTAIVSIWRRLHD
jgi:hypothetical protein